MDKLQNLLPTGLVGKYIGCGAVWGLRHSHLLPQTPEWGSLGSSGDSETPESTLDGDSGWAVLRFRGSSRASLPSQTKTGVDVHGLLTGGSHLGVPSVE